jgi:hypothetical protein
MATWKQHIDAALAKLVSADDAHWTQKGLPNLNVIDEYMRGEGYDGRKLGRKDMPKTFLRPDAPPPAPEPEAPAPTAAKPKEPKEPKEPTKVFVCYRNAQLRGVQHEMGGKKYNFAGEFQPCPMSPEIAEKFLAVDPAFVRTDEKGQSV